MGGERETVVAQKSSTSPEATLLGEIRIHESKGEVHFHDDKAKLKVAIPVHVWSSVWQELSTLRKTKWTYADSDNEAVLRVKMKRSKGKSGSNLEATVRLEKCTTNQVYESLQKFTLAK